MAEVVPLRLLAGRGVEALDQTLLPHEERYVLLDTVEAVCEAVAALRVRGAPLLGIIGAAGVAVAASTRGDAAGTLRDSAAEIGRTRPTAVELATGAEAALRHALTVTEGQRAAALWEFAAAYLARREEEDRTMGAIGAQVLPRGAVLTHCNTGALATGGIGSALGVIRVAWGQGRIERVYATETRPLLQGARLTMWELTRLGIPSALLPDTAAASLLASGRVQSVITGADRIAANGDSANKVGTYGLAAVAARHGVPFFIAAPTTTIDPGCADGAQIPIEFRADSEVGGFGATRWSPPGIATYNPAFDVTPGDLIAGIITERGVAAPPYRDSIAGLLAES